MNERYRRIRLRVVIAFKICIEELRPMLYSVYDARQVGEKRCIAEAVLWTNWKHRGTLRPGGLGASFNGFQWLFPSFPFKIP